LLIAMAGGLTFAKFSVPKARVRFSAPAVVFLFDGVPTLAFRITNERRELVAGVEVTLIAERPERSVEGHEFWRTYELKLRRSRIPALTRGFTVMHPIDAQSPFHGLTPETFAAAKWELEASLLGSDAVSGQVMHATHTWEAPDLRWGHRLADTLIPVDSGPAILDVREFDNTVPCEPTPEFPYPR
jgi:inward rectifier potassium channel